MLMLSKMDRPSYNYVMIFCCYTFVCIYGKGKDLIPSCEVALMVRRGTTWQTAPQQRVVVHCPVKHCGETLIVTWCKLLDVNHCVRINEAENVEIRQNPNHVKGELISYLTFKRISVYDDGLYRCELNDSKPKHVSHTINISVSDLYEEVQNSHNNEVVAMRSADDVPLFWLPYFYICVGIGLLVAILTVLTHLSVHGRKRTLNYKQNNRQDMSLCMIPHLPKRSDPATPVLQTHVSVLNDIYSPNTAGTPSLVTNGNQPLANIGNESQGSDRAVYAVIKHGTSMLPVHKQHAVSNQDKNAEHATISLS